MRCWSCERENLPGVRFCAGCGAGLACPNCGHSMGAAQRFCTHCGHRAPLRGAQTMVRRINRRTLETPHFRIFYPTESYIEQQLGTIAGRLESARAAAVHMLEVHDRAPASIDVRLAELLDDPANPSAPLASGGYLGDDGATIHEVYRPDAPGVTLEHSLILILLAAAVGGDVTLPAFAREGLSGWLGEQIAGGPRQSAYLMEELQRQGQVPEVTAILADPVPGGEGIYVPVATALTGYLIGRYGIARYLEFARRLDPAHPNAAFQAAFGTTVGKIDKEWSRAARASQPGISRFIKASLPYLAPYRLKVVEILFYMGLAIAFTTLMPLSQKWLIDRAILRGNTDELVRIMVGITVLFVIASAATLRENYVSAWVTERIMQSMRVRMFARIQRMEPAFFHRIQTGDIMSRMSNDLLMVQYGITGAMAQGLQMVLTLIVALCTVFYLDWKLGLLGVAGLPIFFITSKVLGPPASRASFQRQQDVAAVTSTLQENLGAQPVVKAFGLEERTTGTYRRQLDTLFRSSLRLTFLSSIYGLTANSIASAIQLSILGIGGYLIIQGEMTLGSLIAFISLLGQMIGPVQSLDSIMQALQQATGSMDRVEELLNMQPSIRDAEGAQPLPRLSRSIRLENVTFSYTGQQPNLEELSLEIPAGSKVAFVGPSGCGKSTTLNLIMRFYDPDQGGVIFDGIDLREATLDSLRSQLGVVFQDNFLFDTSVRENLRMGRLDATDAEVEAAAKAAEIHDLIMTFPLGYDTPVGERGGRVSGGQRQRIAIARAILRNPAVLLLDEATSALDAHTEAAINKTLDRVAAGRTTIAVTHRLTSAAQMDRIFVLDRGRLVEQGSHEELLAKDGLYARLWQEQTGGVSGPVPQFGGIEAMRLGAVPLFAGLDGDLLAALVNRLAVERYAAGDVVINEGERGERMYIIDRGEVEVSVHTPAGSRKLAELRAGDYFGEIALLYDMPRNATVKATTALKLLSLSREDLQDLMTAVPELRAMLEQTVMERGAARSEGVTA